MEQYPSQLLTSAIDEFAKLPGIGRKTALRLTLHLLRQEPECAIHLGESLIRLRKQTAEANSNAGIAAAKQACGYLKEGIDRFRVN